MIHPITNNFNKTKPFIFFEDKAHRRKQSEGGVCICKLALQAMLACAYIT